MLSSTVPRPRPALPTETLCVALQASTASELFALSASLLPDYKFQELRLDSLPDPAAALPALQQHLQRHPAGVFLVTCRTRGSGGGWAAAPEAELALLTAAGAAGVPWVDLSLESAEALGEAAVRSLQRTGAGVVLSWHDFTRTGDLHAVLDRMRPFHPDLRKIVPTAERLEDTLRLLQLFGSAGDGPMVGIAMGEPGVPSRILGPRCGSAFTFAAPTPGVTTAPGQIDAATLRSLYRADRLGPETRLFGVAGSPIRSSLSPLMLNTAFAAAGIDAVDVPLLTGSAEELFAFARAMSLAGCSVTMPLKQAVLPHLAHVDPLAARIGAVNTLRREAAGGYAGFNTDSAGITAPLAERLNLRGARVLVLGAGGAARAAVFGCLAEGARVSVLNRTAEGGRRLAEESGAQALQPADLPHEPPFDALIQATPAGMRGGTATLPVPLEAVNTGLVFDLVYNPLETPLLQAARQRGLEVIPGVEMFLHQGARQFELWTGQPAPLEAMRRVVLEELQRR